MKELLILKESIGSIKEAGDIFKKIKKIKIDYEQENFIVFYLNNQNKLIKSKNVFKGGVNSCLVEPNTIFRNALKHNAIKIIIAHNHPTGDLTPSYEDKDIFKRLGEAGEVINIKVLDSIIFNKKEFYVMRKEFKE